MIKNLLLFAFIVLLLDIPFITYVMKPIYLKLHLANPTIVSYALCAYITMALAWLLIDKSVSKAALTGFLTYGTYAFTLAAVLPGYTLTNALTEISWGTFLFAFATFLTNKLN
jgi:uncharacterized membrane protein